ncbi:hypothetical protein K525DRAFT_269486 [Schizophyllum commune Loenen D]|nr:hypothetical protein K525DRAFT_269486 [Schizophyllum commune Loenen D]
MELPSEGGTPHQPSIRPVLPSLGTTAPAFPTPSAKRKSDSINISSQDKRHRSTYLDPFSRPGTRGLPSLSRYQSPSPPHPPQTYEGYQARPDPYSSTNHQHQSLGEHDHTPQQHLQPPTSIQSTTRRSQTPSTPSAHARSQTPASAVPLLPPPSLPPLGRSNLASNSARITQQPFKPTPSSTTFAPPSSVSRAISDKIASMQNELDDVRASLTRCASARTLDKLQQAVQKLSDENAYLREQNEDLEQRLQQLIDARTADSETLTALAEHVRALENCAVLQPGSATSGDPAASAHDAKPQVKMESDTKGKPRDNLWTKAARQTLLMAMGQSTLASNEAVMQHYVDNEDEYSSLWGSWSTTSDGLKKLVPNFAQSWAENASIHLPLVQFVRQKVHEVAPAITPATMALKSDADIVMKLGTSYRAMSTIFKRLHKEKSAERGVIVNVKPALTKDERRLIAMHRRRKERKAEDRRKALRAEYGEEGIVDWTWFLQWEYQSTDEEVSDAADASESQSAIDPQTDEEGQVESSRAGAKHAGSGMWRSRPPTYRSEILQDVINIADAKHEALRAKPSLNSTRKKARPALRTTRLKGPSKDVALPVIFNSALRIPYKAVSSEWRATHLSQQDRIRTTEGDARVDAGHAFDTDMIDPELLGVTRGSEDGNWDGVDVSEEEEGTYGDDEDE